MPTGQCFCGCGAEVGKGSFFKTGHDKKAEGDMNAIHHDDSVVKRMIDRGYGPGGKNLHEEAIAVGVRERCGIDGCNVTGIPGGPGLRRHRAVRHGLH